MSGPESSPQSGAVGITQRSQQLRNFVRDALTPEEMWRNVVQSQRGFESSPGGSNDTLRQRPATVPIGPHGVGDPKGIGPSVGKGYETFGTIQVLDDDGRRVAIGRDVFSGGGPENHAEARTIRGLDRHMPPTVEGGRMIVVVEKKPCLSCHAKLVEFAKRKGLRTIDVYLPKRAWVRNPGRTVTPKTAARTSFQGKRPTTSLRKLSTIKVPQIKDLRASRPVIHGKSAVRGTITNLGAGMALGIITNAFKDSMQKSIEGLPKPKIDRRAAGEFFSDPKTANSIRLIDLLAKNLAPFSRELSKHHYKVVISTNLELGLLGLSSLSSNEQLEFLGTLEDQLDLYERELQVVYDNLGAAKRLEAKAIESAEAAQELAKMIDRALVGDYLLKSGFSFDEIVTIHSNLSKHAYRVRTVFRELNNLNTQVRRLMDEVSSLAVGVNRLSWRIILSRVIKKVKESESQ